MRSERNQARQERRAGRWERERGEGHGYENQKIQRFKLKKVEISRIRRIDEQQESSFTYLLGRDMRGMYIPAVQLIRSID